MIIRALEEKDLNQLLLLYKHLHDADVALPESSIVEAVWCEISSNPNYR